MARIFVRFVKNNMNERNRVIAARMSPCCTQYGRKSDGREEKTIVVDEMPESAERSGGQLSLLQVRDDEEDLVE